jgi:hypothetical protein
MSEFIGLKLEVQLLQHGFCRERKSELFGHGSPIKHLLDLIFFQVSGQSLFTSVLTS